MWRSVPVRVLLLAVFGGMLAACGGGGSDDDDSDSSVQAQPTATLSGVIGVPAGTLVDLDTATDARDTELAGNNDAASAQPVFNPAVIGGYVSDLAGLYVVQDQQGRPRNRNYPRDPADVFKVRLFAGQTLQLEVHDADHELVSANGEPNQDGKRPRLALRLYREEAPETEIVGIAVGGMLDDVVSVGQLTVPETGDYFIKVTPEANGSADQGGPATYVLRLEQVGLPSGRLSLTDEFVPGEVLVEWETAPQTNTRRSASSALTLVQEAGSVSRMKINHPAFNNTARSGTAPTSAAQLAEQKRITLETIRELRRQPGVQFAEPNYIRRALAVPSDPYYVRQWHHKLINLPAAWNSSQGEGVIVAVIDSGVRFNHPDLAGQFVDGYDFVSDPDIARDGNGYDADPTDPGDEKSGSSFHGTHVSGVVVALAGNGQGGVGTAYGAKVMPLRVLGLKGEGLDYDVAQAELYAAGLDNASRQRPERRADIINLSLGSASFSQTLQTAVDRATQAGVIVVAAAGNESSSQVVYPAGYASVFAVSAVGPDKRKAPYSNYGSSIDLAAPGGNFLLDMDNDGYGDGILSTWADDSYATPRPSYAWMEGTSMAAPQVAGVAALMKAARPSLTVGEFRQYLNEGKLTQRLGDAVYYGKGMIDASKAVSTAITGQPQAILSAFPGSLVFEGFVDAAELTLDNGGSDTESLTLNGAPVAEDGGLGWLSVMPVDVNGSGLGRYQVSVDRTLFVPGVTYAGRILVQSSAGQVEVPVVARMPDPERLANAGTQFLFLLDAQTSLPVRSVKLDPPQDGAYQFTLENVPHGRYTLVVSSDLDNDLEICDGGEACGLYPVGQQQVIRVPEDAGQPLLFNTGFHSSVGRAELSEGNQPAPAGFPRMLP